MHDADGKELKVGDRVAVIFKIEEVQAHPDFCNCMIAIEPADEPFTKGSVSAKMWINTRQSRKVEA